MKKYIAIMTAFVAMAFATPAQADLDKDFQKTWDQVKKEEAGPYDGYAGRNIAEDGVKLPSGKVRDATKAELRDGIAVMDRMLNPAPVVPVAVEAPVEEYAPAPVEAPVASSGVGNATVQCESGGDYSINTGNGYYGGYQFDSQTWDAYGDSSYSEAHLAPPAVQDAAAASVPYDAWPNC